MILSEPLSPSMKLRYVIDVEEGLITQHSHEIGYLNNGVECYFVEVTTKKGIQWGYLGIWRGRN